MKNPRWHRNELILTLNLYVNIEKGKIQASNPEIIKLSKTLNSLKIHNSVEQFDKFRNPNGVALKLSNFAAIDPDYSGKGMRSFSKLDKEIFFEFHKKRNFLQEECNRIINETESNYGHNEYLHFEEDFDENYIPKTETKHSINKHSNYYKSNIKISKKNSLGKIICTNVKHISHKLKLFFYKTK